MRRSRLRAGLLVVVALALAGIGLQVWRSVAGRGARSLEEMGMELLPEVAQHIRNFRRVKVKDGRMEWEITAQDARYFEKQDAIVVQGPEVTFQLEGGTRRGHLTGKSGRLLLHEKEIESVVLTGDVVLIIDDLELHTDEATYQRASQQVTAPGAVNIRGREIDVQARGMEFDVEPRKMRLLADVRTVLRRDAAAS